jgi:hypothetical protein
MRKRTKYIIGVLGIVIVVSLLSSQLFSTTIGGTSWRFDYELTRFHINGSPENTEELPGTPSHDYSGEVPPTPGVYQATTYRDAFQWWADPDGNPIYDGYQWGGLLPDVGHSVSLPGRVDKDGNSLAFDAVDPGQVAHNYGDRIVYEYYYEFTIEAMTRQDIFIVPGTIQTLFQPWQSCEAGDMDLTTTLTVFVKDPAGSVYSGSFADAKITEVDYIDMQLGSALAWVVTPSVSIMQDVGTGVPVANRQDGDGYYSCDLTFTCGLTPGVTKAGLNNNPYDLWLIKTVQMTLLLEEPLDVGQGSSQQGQGPPLFLADIPLWLLALAGVLAVVALVAVCFIVRALSKFR